MQNFEVTYEIKKEGPYWFIYVSIPGHKGSRGHMFVKGKRIISITIEDRKERLAHLLVTWKKIPIKKPNEHPDQVLDLLLHLLKEMELA